MALAVLDRGLSMALFVMKRGMASACFKSFSNMPPSNMPHHYLEGMHKTQECGITGSEQLLCLYTAEPGEAAQGRVGHTYIRQNKYYRLEQVRVTAAL